MKSCGSARVIRNQSARLDCYRVPPQPPVYLVIENGSLPTPLALVVRRLNVCGPENSADTFLTASYVAEAAIKLIGIGLVAGLKERAPDHAYRLEHDFIRADGLGTWEDGIRQTTSQPLAGFLNQRMRPLLSWATTKRSQEQHPWFADAASELAEIFALLGLESDIPRKKPTSQHLITALVQLRNKTRAHGAAGADFWAPANPRMIKAVDALIGQCPLFDWRWIHLSIRENGEMRGVWLRGTDPKHARDSELSSLRVPSPGIYICPGHNAEPVPLGTLVRSNRECSEFWLPNGGWRQAGQASFIDYGKGLEERRDAADYLRAPVALPPSETEGLGSLVVQSNVLGNLPDLPGEYVSRPNLEAELRTRLEDRNHPIVTLHGRGGIGKTSVALSVAHALADQSTPLFDEII